MINHNISLILVYEPDTAAGRPTPLARTADPQLILAVAEHAITDATSRATILSQSDEVLGELERAEVDRLRAVLATLIPQLRSRNNRHGTPVM
jgi:hypothetical protein